MFKSNCAGTLPASLHRVLVPTPDSRLRTEPRQSLVYFIIADEDTIVEPVTEGPKKEEYEEPIMSGEHVKQLLKAINYFWMFL